MHEIELVEMDLVQTYDHGYAIIHLMPVGEFYAI